MRTGLVISTYNAPQCLELVLASVRAQTRPPDQVLVADDGSGPETRSVVDTFRSRVGFPVLHCWQDDKGFRKTRILNQAILRARTEYLIFVDGDMLLHHAFVSDHCQIAKPGRYTQGRRICLNRAATARRWRTKSPRVRFFHPGCNRRTQMVRSRWLMAACSTEDQNLKNSRGCNQAFWRQDLLDVNGYEERLEGWGREDSEICARLHHLGRTRIYARHWALAWHLYHPELSRQHDDANQRLLQETIERRAVRAIQGLDQHMADRGNAA